MYFNEWWKGRVIRLIGKEAYFFNEEGIYSKISAIEAGKIELEDLEFICSTGEYIRTGFLYSIEISRAIASLHLGDSIEKFEKDIERFRELYENNKFKLTNTVFRISNKKFYFFDENGKYSCLREKDILPSNIIIDNIYIGSNNKYSCSIALSQLEKTIKVYNGNILKSALCKMKIGDTIQKLVEYCNTVTFETRKLPEGVERFITRIERPKFICVPENPNKDATFDYLHIYVGIVSEWKEDRKKYIRDHIREINEMVLEKIENDKTFLKYGIPINFLRFSKVTLIKRTSEIQFILELTNID